jgi:hypothetical protein
MQCRGGGGVIEMADRQRPECNIASRRKAVSDRQLAEDRALFMLQTAGRRQKEKGSKQKDGQELAEAE